MLYPEETPEGIALINAANSAIEEIQLRQVAVQRRLNNTFLLASAEKLRAEYEDLNKEINDVRTRMVADLEAIDMSQYNGS